MMNKERCDKFMEAVEEVFSEEFADKIIGQMRKRENYLLYTIEEDEKRRNAMYNMVVVDKDWGNGLAGFVLCELERDMENDPDKFDWIIDRCLDDGDNPDYDEIAECIATHWYDEYYWKELSSDIDYNVWCDEEYLNSDGEE